MYICVCVYCEDWLVKKLIRSRSYIYNHNHNNKYKTKIYFTCIYINWIFDAMKINTKYFINLTFTQIFVIWDVFFVLLLSSFSSSFFLYFLIWRDIFIFDILLFNCNVLQSVKIWETNWLQPVAIEWSKLSFV